MTFIEAMDTIMPTFDAEIRRLAERLLIKPRRVDTRTGVFAAEVIPGIPGKKPVTIRMVDAKTKAPVETLEVDACLVATGRAPNTAELGLEQLRVTLDKGGFVPVDGRMRVLTSREGGKVVKGLYCIGDANGKMMLAHAASAQVSSACAEGLLELTCVPSLFLCRDCSHSSSSYLAVSLSHLCFSSVGCVHCVLSCRASLRLRISWGGSTQSTTSMCQPPASRTPRSPWWV